MLHTFLNLVSVALRFLTNSPLLVLGLVLGLVLRSFDHWKCPRMRRRRVHFGFGFETSIWRLQRPVCGDDACAAAANTGLASAPPPKAGGLGNRPILKRRTVPKTTMSIDLD